MRCLSCALPSSTCPYVVCALNAPLQTPITDTLANQLRVSTWLRSAPATSTFTFVVPAPTLTPDLYPGASCSLRRGSTRDAPRNRIQDDPHVRPPPSSTAPGASQNSTSQLSLTRSSSTKPADMSSGMPSCTRSAIRSRPSSSSEQQAPVAPPPILPCPGRNLSRRSVRARRGSTRTTSQGDASASWHPDHADRALLSSPSCPFALSSTRLHCIPTHPLDVPISSPPVTLSKANHLFTPTTSITLASRTPAYILCGFLLPHPPFLPHTSPPPHSSPSITTRHQFQKPTPSLPTIQTTHAHWCGSRAGRPAARTSGTGGSSVSSGVSARVQTGVAYCVGVWEAGIEGGEGGPWRSGTVTVRCLCGLDILVLRDRAATWILGRRMLLWSALGGHVGAYLGGMCIVRATLLSRVKALGDCAGANATRRVHLVELELVACGNGNGGGGDGDGDGPTRSIPAPSFRVLPHSLRPIDPVSRAPHGFMRSCVVLASLARRSRVAGPGPERLGAVALGACTTPVLPAQRGVSDALRCEVWWCVDVSWIVCAASSFAVCFWAGKMAAGVSREGGVRCEVRGSGFQGPPKEAWSVWAFEGEMERLGALCVWFDVGSSEQSSPARVEVFRRL
ncbi:uncharacterized protein LAESUDRAFT_758109 [Laetiporus sulphureus 93-53]|uniref:Uncharacterized protein n=1 Tax=Laetiporus sulphureus 93-53 TaxID=1314785 RepID=A0A165EYG4_9APHY|nr:uncharacterized protein LAESUDRAFT_758109 [Laetiporus sulphureus 93-53]KZT07980.1 hypothetical protein LAESUDRAFT_758109 [Laetiporus sulphureus 93-53]